MTWKDDTQQPRDQQEKANIAAEAMGGNAKTSNGRPRAPKFHRMSIAAAANGGITVDHTRKVRVKAGKSGGEHFRGSSLPTSGDDGMAEKNSGPHVFGPDHPIMRHINAIHDHIMQSMPGMGQEEDGSGGVSD